MRLKDLRLQKGLGLKEAADRIGIADTALWRWEQGTVTPSGKYLPRLADLFGANEVMQALKEQHHA